MRAALEGSHQHAKSGKLYTYRADYSVNGGDIHWNASVHRADQLQLHPGGTISTGTPAAIAIAEQAVRDAVITAIDAAEDSSDF